MQRGTNCDNEHAVKRQPSRVSNIYDFSLTVFSLLLELKLLAIKETASNAVKIPRIVSLFKAQTYPLKCVTDWFTLTKKLMLYNNNAVIGFVELQPADVFIIIIMHFFLGTSALLIWIYSKHTLLSVMDIRSNICAWILLQDLCTKSDRGKTSDFEIMQIIGRMRWISERIRFNFKRYFISLSIISYICI